MTIAANLGYPRIGPKRELKTALEAFWAGKASEAELHTTAAALRAGARAIQQGSGISHVPSADFALYDHVLETACAFGLVPPGYGWSGEGPVSLATMFALARGARGSAAERAAGIPGDAVALEMTKWFDTNYHYMVPRLSAAMRPRLLDNRWARAVREGLQHGTRTRPVLLGPVSLLLLSKAEDGTRPLELLPALLPAYADALRFLAEAGAVWVQLDEPCLVTDLPAGADDAYRTAFRALAEAAPGLNLLLATYFEGLRDNLALAASLPVAGLHVDLVRAPGQLPAVLEALPRDRWLSLGVVDGRNVWRTDLRAAPRAAPRGGGGGLRQAADGRALLLAAARAAQLGDGDRARPRAEAPPRLRQREAEGGRDARPRRGRGREGRRRRLRGERPSRWPRRAPMRGCTMRRVAARLAAATPEMERRASPYPARAAAQAARLGLPELPVTSIGSWPQTAEVRSLRARLARGELDQASLRRGDGAPDRRGRALAGGDRRGRARPWRVRAQRHGEVFRRAARRLRLHEAWLGAELRQPLRRAADHLGRCLAPGADDGALVRLRAVADVEADEGHADRAGDHAAMVLRARRHPARDGLPADRARHPRRGGRPRSGRHPDHPDRRAGLPRGPAAAPGGPRRLPALGGRLLPPLGERGARRDADPHPHVLFRVQRHHREHRGDGCRRDLDRDRAQRHGAAGGLRGLRLSERDRAGRVGHPLAARAIGRGDGAVWRAGRRSASRAAGSGSTPIAAARRAAGRR